MWRRGADGQLSVIDLLPPTDDEVAELARTVSRKMTVMVDAWHEARGDAEDPEQAHELSSLAVTDMAAAAPRIDDMPTVPRTGRLAALCDGYSLEC